MFARLRRLPAAKSRLFEEFPASGRPWDKKCWVAGAPPRDFLFGGFFFAIWVVCRLLGLRLSFAPSWRGLPLEIAPGKNRLSLEREVCIRAENRSDFGADPDCWLTCGHEAGKEKCPFTCLSRTGSREIEFG